MWTGQSLAPPPCPKACRHVHATRRCDRLSPRFGHRAVRLDSIAGLRRAKSPQHGIKPSGHAPRLPRLKNTAHDLKPDAHDDVGRQLHVLYGQAPLSPRLG